MQKATALPILMYHHVSPNPGLVTVSPAAFRAQMEALAGAGWRTAGLDEAARFFRGEAVPAKTCVVTFDDGYLDNQVHAAPVLRDCGLAAVIFTVTGWLGEGPRSWRLSGNPGSSRMQAAYCRRRCRQRHPALVGGRASAGRRGLRVSLAHAYAYPLGQDGGGPSGKAGGAGQRPAAVAKTAARAAGRAQSPPLLAPGLP